MTPSLISCDWGSTSFRLRAVASDGRCLAERRSARGASSVGAPGLSPADREERFAAILAEELAALDPACAQAPVCVSGMATSAHGWLELPYAPAPLALDGSGLVTARRRVEGHAVTLVSGVRTDCDVMRGEECELLGLYRAHPELAQENVLVLLPGTHAKHVRVVHGELRGFRTAMTGELFALLKEHSVLRHSLAGASATPPGGHDGNDAFRRGFADSRADGLLAALFQVRTRALLHGADPGECADYLNGALLGDELRGTGLGEWDRIVLCAPASRSGHYRRAFAILGIGTPVLELDEPQLGRLVPCGHLAVMDHQHG